MAIGTSRKNLASKFCNCIKAVRRTVKARGKNQSKAAKEGAAIAICTRAVLGSRGRTLRKFKCGKKAVLQTQNPIKNKNT
jgi:hypothetical protein